MKLQQLPLALALALGLALAMTASGCAQDAPPAPSAETAAVEQDRQSPQDPLVTFEGVSRLCRGQGEYFGHGIAFELNRRHLGTVPSTVTSWAHHFYIGQKLRVQGDLTVAIAFGAFE